jgi:hypothetical protein
MVTRHVSALCQGSTWVSTGSRAERREKQKGFSPDELQPKCASPFFGNKFYQNVLQISFPGKNLSLISLGVGYLSFKIGVRG